MTKTVIVVEFFARLGIVNKVLLIQMKRKREQTASTIARMKRQLNITSGNLDKILPEIMALSPVRAMLMAVVIEKRIVNRIILIINTPNKRQLYFMIGLNG